MDLRSNCELFAPSLVEVLVVENIVCSHDCIYGRVRIRLLDLDKPCEILEKEGRSMGMYVSSFYVPRQSSTRCRY